MSALQKFATAAVMLAALMAANVVAAGVSRVLGEITLAAGPEVSSQPWPWLVITLAAVGAAVFFLQGAMPAGLKLLKHVGRL